LLPVGQVQSLYNSFFACAPNGIATGSGDIYFYSTNRVQFTTMNFTKCSSAAAGSVFKTQRNLDISWACSYFTVVRCSGATGLDCTYGTPRSVSFSNFYSNSLKVLRGDNCGILLDRCIFFGNWPDLTQSSDSGSASHRFRSSFCVFFSEFLLVSFETASLTVSISPSLSWILIQTVTIAVTLSVDANNKTTSIAS
jgi:hypothetical protein